jgi:hypothetical protein
MAQVSGRLTVREVRRRPRRLAYRENPATMAQDVTTEVLKIIDGRTVFRLTTAIDLAVRREGPHVVVAYEPLGIEECGKTKAEALDAFAYHFGALWEQFVECEDGALTGDARQLKRKMRSLVAGVSRQP